jgi:hypothetical protein
MVVLRTPHPPPPYYANLINSHERSVSQRRGESRQNKKGSTVAGLQHRGVKMDVAGMRARLAFTQTLEADLQIGLQAIETSGRNPQSSAGFPERLNQVENWVIPMAVFIMLTWELTRHKRDTFLP